MTRFRPSRRTVLRGLGGVPLALPWLEAVERPARAAPGIAPSGFPKRFLVWYASTGYVRSAWVPTGTETSFTLGPSTSPLEPFKEQLVMTDGIDNTVDTVAHSGGDTHSSGMCTMLSGVPSLFVPVSGESGGGHSRASGGVTLDQELVARLKPATRFPSLEVAINRAAGSGYSTVSYLGADRALLGENAPGKVFARIFGGGTPGAGVDPAVVQRAWAERRSVLDAVDRTFAGLRPKLGRADQGTVDAHLTLLRDLEKRWSTPPAPPAAGCTTTAAPADSMDIQAIGKAQIDLMVAALACDLTRVGTIQWSNTVSGQTFPFLGITRSHHDLSHETANPGPERDAVVKIDTWRNQQLAYLLGKLKAVKQGNDTLLDNTLVLAVSCLGVYRDGRDGGAPHARTNLPILLAGRAGGAVRTGRFLRFTDRDRSGYRNSNQNLYVSILNAFDVPAQSFGNPMFCAGPLAGL